MQSCRSPRRLITSIIHLFVVAEHNSRISMDLYFVLDARSSGQKRPITVHDSSEHKSNQSLPQCVTAKITVCKIYLKVAKAWVSCYNDKIAVEAVSIWQRSLQGEPIDTRTYCMLASLKHCQCDRRKGNGKSILINVESHLLALQHTATAASSNTRYRSRATRDNSSGCCRICIPSGTG